MFYPSDEVIMFADFISLILGVVIMWWLTEKDKKDVN